MKSLHLDVGEGQVGRSSGILIKYACGWYLATHMQTKYCMYLVLALHKSPVLFTSPVKEAAS